MGRTKGELSMEDFSFGLDWSELVRIVERFRRGKRNRDLCGMLDFVGKLLFVCVRS